MNKILLTSIILFTLIFSGCTSPAFIQGISIHISEENNYLSINETQVYKNNSFDKTNLTYSIIISAPEENKVYTKNATIRGQKLIFEDRNFFSIRTPKKGDKFTLNIEFLQGKDDMAINDFERTSYISGSIVIIDNDKIEFIIEETDLPYKNISVTNKQGSQIEIIIETLSIMLEAQVAT